MSDDKITFEDVEEYESLFTLVPSFLIERFARKNTNIVLKFESVIRGYMDTLTPDQKNKLDIILDSDVDDLQKIMNESYIKTGKSQFKVLANPKYKRFIENNLNEIRKMI